ncbi:hypothetical protein [Nocardioides hwasunensis]|uniref:30S ribosomal protein S12 n=1 Tax=Nocardioides hwasunensis TaxID=397258 RepID=A0ABR8MJ33_9ACTN|nr:hypothetical protein [Nocardioides hwasunensis]MBD3916055.1 hypothetical protein [Nocardioides hwasunensis]
MGSKSAAKKGKAKVAKLPKKKCCVSTTRCKRCPIRMLKEGTLPSGYTVKKRRLVKVEVTTGSKKSGKKGATKAA